MSVPDHESAGADRLWSLLPSLPTVPSESAKGNLGKAILLAEGLAHPRPVPVSIRWIENGPTPSATGGPSGLDIHALSSNPRAATAMRKPGVRSAGPAR